MTRSRYLQLAAIALPLLMATIAASSAHDFTIGDLTVDHPWSRQTPSTAAVGVGYLTITNNGSEPDRLVGGSAELAEGFEIHTSESSDGVARMRRLEDSVPIEPGATVELRPLGTHVMLTGLKRPIERDRPFEGTLVFERAGTLEVTFAVEALGAPSPAADEHEGHAR